MGDVQPAAEGDVVETAAYLPLSQADGPGGALLSWHSSMNVVIRHGDPKLRSRRAHAHVLSLDPNLPPANLRPLRDELSALVAGPRFSATVLAIFAVVALVMASLGVYGVMAYTAGQRTREIGVRVALGASDGQVLRLIMRDGVIVVGAGLGAGLIAAAWLAKTLTGLLLTRLSRPSTISRLRKPTSASTSTTRFPRAARAVPTLAVVVVLPTPPFPLVMTIARPRAVAGASEGALCGPVVPSGSNARSMAIPPSKAS